MERVEAPWTQEQVDSLNGYQQAGCFHPFTGERKANGDQVDLIATPEGWVEVAGGPVVQTWAYRAMTDGAWKDTEIYRVYGVKP